MSAVVYPNLSEIISVTLRNRSAQFAVNVLQSNKFLADLLEPWEPQEAGTVPMPDFIRLSAQGKAKIKNGRVYLLKESDHD